MSVQLPDTVITIVLSLLDHRDLKSILVNKVSFRFILARSTLCAELVCVPLVVLCCALLCCAVLCCVVSCVVRVLHDGCQWWLLSSCVVFLQEWAECARSPWLWKIYFSRRFSWMCALNHPLESIPLISDCFVGCLFAIGWLVDVLVGV